MQFSDPIRVDPPALRELARDIVQQAVHDRRSRYILGVAGIPASGKSTLARRLTDALVHCLGGPTTAACVSLDGFHKPMASLSLTERLARKGSPEAIDVDAYLNLLKRAKDPLQTVIFPVYCRQRHEPIWRDTPAQTIGPHTRVIVTDGPYLLAEDEPWACLEDLLDGVWLLDTPIALARQWIVDRHIRAGIPRNQAERLYREHDRRIIDEVLTTMREPDRCLQWADFD